MFNFDDYPAPRDSLGYDDPANRLATMLDNSILPVSIGLFGRWGSGKSTFLSLLEKHMIGLQESEPEDDKERTYFFVNFEPWKLDGGDELLHDLISSIHIEAEKQSVKTQDSKNKENDSDKKAKEIFEHLDHIGSVSEIAQSISSGIAEKVFGGGGVGRDVFKKIGFRDSGKSAKKRVNATRKFPTLYKQYLSTLSAIPVVLIDDLDRCSPRTVISVLETLQSYLSMEKVDAIYVLAMDHEMVTKAICRAYSYENWRDGWQFLSKICNVSYYLPRPKIKGLIETHIKKRRAKKADPLESYWIFLNTPEVERLLYDCDFYLPRRLKRVLNELFMALSPIAHNFMSQIEESLSNTNLELEDGSPDILHIIFRHLLGVFVLREAYPELYTKFVNRMQNKRSTLLSDLGYAASKGETLEARAAAMQLVLRQRGLSELRDYTKEPVLVDLFERLFGDQSQQAVKPKTYPSIPSKEVIKDILDPLLDILMGK